MAGTRGIHMISENQINYIKKTITEIEYGKLTIVIKDNGEKLDIITEKRYRISREDDDRKKNT
jgi:hypothetical protein